MRWYELIVDCSLSASEAVMALLHDYCGGVVIEETDLARRYRCYLPDNEALPGALEEIRSRLANLPAELLEAGAPVLSNSWLEDEDWAHAWKSYWQPQRLGQRLVVKPSWKPWPPPEAPEAAREDDIIIELDPGMAFGTGSHATTRLCLLALEERLVPGMEVIDLGCGSGLLSIAALKLGATRVLAIDTDPLAVEATIENCARNGVGPCEVVQQAGLALAEGDWDLIVGNISAPIIKSETPLAAARLRPGGLFICSGFFEGYLEEIGLQLQEHGLQVLAESVEEHWACIHAVKQ